jgi:membrane protease YdiL (CAAX protease family)
MIPREVWDFLADEWAALARLVATLAAMAAGLVAAPHAASGWLVVAIRAALVVLVLVHLLLVPTYRAWLRFLTLDQWRAIDAETPRDPAQAGTFDWRVLVILIVVAVSLTIQEYIGDRGFFEAHWPASLGNRYYELEGFAWWSGWRVFGYVVMPMVTLLCMPGARIRDAHLSLRGFFHHLWIYVLLFLLVLPAVILASKTPEFRHTYPFYRLANRSSFDLWTWEALYGAQFVSLEIFFRGFILQGLRRALGSNAIFVMIVPYCMIHYGKPLPETLGAIVAGLILGTLAMRTKSIWGGVLIHIGVAMTMDVLALHGCPPIGSGKYCGE